MSVNKTILVGHLGANPSDDLRYTPNGNAVCNLRLATNRTWKNSKGEKQTETQWHRIVVWGDTAESCAKYLSKGRQIYVEGRLQTRSWEDKDKNKRYTTEVVAERVQFLGSAQQGAQYQQIDTSEEEATQQSMEETVSVGSLPF